MIVDRFNRFRSKTESDQTLTGKDLIRGLLTKQEQNGSGEDATILRQYLDEGRIGIVSAQDTDPCGRDGIGVAIGLERVPREAYVVMVVNDSIVRKMNGKNIRKFIGEVRRHIFNLNLDGYPLGQVTEEIAGKVLSIVEHEH